MNKQLNLIIELNVAIVANKIGNLGIFSNDGDLWQILNCWLSFLVAPGLSLLCISFYWANLNYFERTFRILIDECLTGMSLLVLLYDLLLNLSAPVLKLVKGFEVCAAILTYLSRVDGCLVLFGTSKTH